MSTGIIQPNQVNTELLTLEKVNSRKMGFIIPSYQRPYVWSEDDVKKLFDDIKEAYLNAEPHYFIGSVLSAIRPVNGTDTYELIDGQQRTTTLMLVSIAFKNVGIESPLAEVSLLDAQPRLNFEIRPAVRNLLGSKAGIETLSRPGDDAIDNDPYLKHLSANLKVLTDLVQTFQEQLQTHSVLSIEAFAEYVFKQVGWVNNIVPETMDLNRLFASMNTAGIQLEPVDLLKAKLLKIIKTDKVLYSRIWEACEHTENYFERNLRQLFSDANWNAIEYGMLKSFSSELFNLANSAELEGTSSKETTAKTLQELFGDLSETTQANEGDSSSKTNEEPELDDETVYCRSIISFELLLIHTLRIFFARKGWEDLRPRIKAGNLMACFKPLVALDESDIKEFIELLWQVRYQFDTWIVKWVEHDDQNDPQLRLTSISRSLSSGKYYINRTARELSALVQLQAVRNFTGDRSAHYWLGALLQELVETPDMSYEQVLETLERIDNQLSLTTETQKEATYKLLQGQLPMVAQWSDQAGYFELSHGTSFEHYWFQKIEYLLWKQGGKTNDERLKRYRITSKNSVEHVHPQNEEYQNKLDDKVLNAFGNLVLLSPGENSSYSNQTVGKKKADFDVKPRYDSLKLREIFKLYAQSNNQWTEREIAEHQAQMQALLKQHYTNS
jgi:uncharacterized protein with ParB-like and HNH nuclease domain